MAFAVSTISGQQALDGRLQEKPLFSSVFLFPKRFSKNFLSVIQPREILRRVVGSIQLVLKFCDVDRLGKGLKF